jgi:hypothetical protein
MYFGIQPIDDYNLLFPPQLISIFNVSDLSDDEDILMRIALYNLRDNKKILYYGDGSSLPGTYVIPRLRNMALDKIEFIERQSEIIKIDSDEYDFEDVFDVKSNRKADIIIFDGQDIPANKEVNVLKELAKKRDEFQKQILFIGGQDISCLIASKEYADITVCIFNNIDNREASATELILDVAIDMKRDKNSVNVNLSMKHDRLTGSYRKIPTAIAYQSE